MRFRKRGNNMSAIKNISGIEPLPHYVMPDGSAPAYDEIMEQLQDYQHSLIGSSYYYIRTIDQKSFICRILPGGGKIFFHELIDHEKYGISHEEIEHAVSQDTDQFSVEGCHPISAHIESKLRVILDYP
jgi:hypothetical protein